MAQSLDGSILTPGGWIRGRVSFDAGVLGVEGTATDAPEPPYVLPGFVDLHVHGGGGADMMEGRDAIRAAAARHARHGTTSLLATSVTAPVPATEAFLDAVREVATGGQDAGSARVLGAHLEGPFLNPGKLGAQPPFAIPGDAELIRAWLARAPVRVVTLAPECDNGTLIPLLLAAGVRPQMGHSLCAYAEAARALAAGCGVTHLFNAMTGIAHRGNGIAGAALAHADWAEVIPDLIHVEAGAILAARRAIPNLYGVTDATAGAGMPDGDYRLGGRAVSKRGGAMRLADGTLAGSALTMDAGLRNLVSIGLPLEEASRRLSTLPAQWIGLDDAGRIEAGARADLVVLDGDLAVQAVHVAGTRIEG